MAGRKPTFHFTPCYDQFTVTIDGKLHRLGKDEEEAQKKFRFLLRQSDQGMQVDPNITFHEVSDYFLQHVKENHAPERYRHCRERLQEFKDHLGTGFKVKDLRPGHVNSWMKPKQLTSGSQRLYKSIILACLNWAARPKDQQGGELIHENPLRGRLHLPAGESRGKDAVWTKETFEQVLRVASPAFCDLARMLAWTGARPSTIIRIEARHYNKRQSRWDCEDLVRGEKKYVRHVRLLNDEARALVEKLNKEHPTGPIFRNAWGNPWEADAPQIYLFNLQNKFQQTKDLDWQEGLCMYGLRHTFATNFLQQFPNEIEYLRVLLGHKDYKMIFAHYGHLIDAHAEAFKRLEGFDPFKQDA